MDYKIEKGVPVPARRCWGRRSKLLFVMDEGDSFVCEHKDAELFRWTAGRLKMKSCVRKTEDGNARFWLLEKAPHSTSGCAVTSNNCRKPK